MGIEHFRANKIGNNKIKGNLGKKDRRRKEGNKRTKKRKKEGNAGKNKEKEEKIRGNEKKGVKQETLVSIQPLLPVDPASKS